jgi:outer membrane lipoprotein-sorting protein
MTEPSSTDSTDSTDSADSADVRPAAGSHPAPRAAPSRHWRLARWLAPAAVATVIGLLASGVLHAGADPNLPPQSAAQLLAAIGDAKLVGFSGTVVEKASLGLPELPQLNGADSATGLAGLLTGSHTVRVWYGGQTRQRIALLSSLGEQDVFRNGRELWQWNSDTRTASHIVLPADTADHPGTLPATITPDEAARRALALIDPSTAVSTERAALVAGRAAYVLVLRPRDERSRVGSVRISVDGKTKIPLGVQVLARGSDRPAIDITFTRFSDAMPSADNFDWTPPAGVTVKEGGATNPATPPAPAGKGSTAAGEAPDITSVGTGWTTIVKLTGAPTLPLAGKQSSAESGSNSSGLGSVLAGLPEVKGSWGSGRLLRSALLSVLVTDDGRTFVGAVDPELLYAAAASK